MSGGSTSRSSTVGGGSGALTEACQVGGVVDLQNPCGAPALVGAFPGRADVQVVPRVSGAGHEVATAIAGAHELAIAEQMPRPRVAHRPPDPAWNLAGRLIGIQLIGRRILHVEAVA